MEGQVEGLTDRVADVDSSLNYMVGQLSLVVQEFNQVYKSQKVNLNISYFIEQRLDFKIQYPSLWLLQVKTNLADGINSLGNELEDIKEYKPSDSSSHSNGQSDI